MVICAGAIEQWLATGARTSPTTNEPLASLQLLPNHLAKKAIADEIDARRRDKATGTRPGR